MRRFLLVLPFVSVACGGVYELPPPPPVSDRGPVALDPSEEQRLDGERYLAARRAVVALYAALDSQDWETAAGLLSNETRLLLTGGGNGRPEDALAAGTVTVDGTTYRFDPVTLFLLPDPTGFEDDIEGEEQHETARRKELFVVNVEGYRSVVVIEEGGAWRLHLRSWPMEHLSRTRP